jgi:glutamate carboxypeptidase
MNPTAPGKPIALSGHVDTVHPVGSFARPSYVEDGKLFAPGAEDCKGGIVAALLAMVALDECGFSDRPVMLLLQSHEEISSITSNKTTVAYMAEKARDCAAFLNAEPNPDGQLILERKGILRYVFTCKGRAVHSSTCQKGVNAVADAAHRILALEAFKDSMGITCNCSMIRGGQTPNSVPDECSFTADFRYRTLVQRDEVEAFVRDLVGKIFLEGAVCTVREKSRRICMERTDVNERLLCNMNHIFEKVQLPRSEGIISFGGSDAADMTAAGIPCLDGFGVTGGRCHSTEEYMDTDSLPLAAKRMAAIALYL